MSLDKEALEREWDRAYRLSDLSGTPGKEAYRDGYGKAVGWLLFVLHTGRGVREDEKKHFVHVSYCESQDPYLRNLARGYKDGLVKLGSYA